MTCDLDRDRVIHNHLVYPPSLAIKGRARSVSNHLTAKHSALVTLSFTHPFFKLKNPNSSEMSSLVERTCVITVVFCEVEQIITRTPPPTYEEFIQIVSERYRIPQNFQQFIVLTNQMQYPFSKRSFELSLDYFAKPMAKVYIRLNFDSFLSQLNSGLREMFSEKFDKYAFTNRYRLYSSLAEQAAPTPIELGLDEEMAETGTNRKKKTSKKASTRRGMRF